MCVCVCAFVFAGPRHALQTGLGLVSREQTRHDPSESLFSFREMTEMDRGWIRLLVEMEKKATAP